MKKILKKLKHLNSGNKKSSKLKSLLSSKKLKFILLLALFLLIFYVKKDLFIAATVNGKPITRLKLINLLEKQGGKQTLEYLINQELILQEARKKNISISEEAIQEEIKAIKENVSLQGSDLNSLLAAQGMSLKDLEENIKIKKTIEEILKDKIQVSDEEINNYFQQNKQLYPDANFEDIKENLKSELIQMKLQNEYQSWITNLKNTSNIKYFISF